MLKYGSWISFCSFSMNIYISFSSFGHQYGSSFCSFSNAQVWIMNIHWLIYYWSSMDHEYSSAHLAMLKYGSWISSCTFSNVQYRLEDKWVADDRGKWWLCLGDECVSSENNKCDVSHSTRLQREHIFTISTVPKASERSEWLILWM